MTAPLPQLDHCLNWRDHAAQAQAVLSEAAWAYFSAGAGDERALARNQAAWEGLQLWPRVLRRLRQSSPRSNPRPPVFLAPVAYQKLAHPDGELASAAAAAALQTGLVLSAQSSTSLEAVARAMRGSEGAESKPTETAPGPLSPLPHASAATADAEVSTRWPDLLATRLWAQLYWQNDRGLLREWLARVEAAGFEALALTVDAPLQSPRERERRLRASWPSDIWAVNWPRGCFGQSDSAEAALAQAPTWNDVAWLQAQTRLPLLLKGVLHPADAQQASELGLAGVVVSNHGGRMLDAAASTAWALPQVVQAVQERMWILVDGGIRRGVDIVKALALGADAVMIGRPYVYGLAHAGAFGVAHVLRLLLDEWRVAMAQCGVATAAEGWDFDRRDLPQVLGPNVEAV